MEERQKKHLDDVERALLDMVESCSWKWHDIQQQTGLSEERCKEIVKIAQRIEPK